ncbi:ABC transporter permease subunit [Xinfangfangia sp. CPCC 101601]|uniref:Oligopeptide transport system permease protein OppC n=1 Tax=Pseudogemmobacter lacusdianii TaxID=3069608 RepID=A0ABU0VZK8_9RHOB|nr:ABC transporter permease subunit [Xinfangfangia sp. CPCC 101601]MDQ2066330.1 ABC transporter permease subunit [Xinfangfangia sp. CPCC 101601]
MPSDISPPFAAPTAEPASTLRLQFRRFRKNRLAMASVYLLTLIVLMCFFGPMFFPFTGEDADFDNIGAPVNLFSIHPFGTDDYGRDLFIRVLEGGQVSLTIGFLGALVAGGIGVLYGAAAGYVGGRLDGFMMRLVEVLYGFPYVILVILLSLLFGGGTVSLFAAIVFTLWLTPAVIVRAQAQSLAQREFIQAARAGGMTGGRIVLQHIVPNCVSVVIVYGSLLVPEVILSESFLSFLGIGVKEPQASWGNLIQVGTSAMSTDLRLLLLPGGLLATVLFCLNFIADGLRDAFDPNDR